MEYEDKVGSMLLSLKIGDVFKIDSFVAQANRPRFDETVKSYINRHLGHLDGWAIEFNGSFEDGPAPTKIRKINIKHKEHP